MPIVNMADVIDETLIREEVEQSEEEEEVEHEETTETETTEHGRKVEDDNVQVKEQIPQEFVLEGIPREKDLTSWEIPKFMATYLQKYAREHVPDTDVAAWLEEYPPPSNVSLVPELDGPTKTKLRSDGGERIILVNTSIRNSTKIGLAVKQG